MSADVRFKKLFRLQCFLDAEKVISTHQPKKVTKEYLIEYEFERIVWKDMLNLCADENEGRISRLAISSACSTTSNIIESNIGWILIAGTEIYPNHVRTLAHHQSWLRLGRKTQPQASEVDGGGVRR